jgi:hypothetical protein
MRQHFLRGLPLHSDLCGEIEVANSVRIITPFFEVNGKFRRDSHCSLTIRFLFVGSDTAMKLTALCL